MAYKFNPLDHPICLQQPRRLVRPDPWVEHIPFGMLLIELVKPKIFVELGTHSGNSYCAFCQAVQELRLSTMCYAVDTWEGDEQSGKYGLEVLKDLRKHHDPLYSQFSNLLKTTFDDAVHSFKNGSIDLLHIDGLHTYDAVRHDYETWLPKMTDQGIVVFHDTAVIDNDFGVWKLWQELKDSHPSFNFSHGHGLGIIALGTKIESEMERFLSIKDGKKEVKDLFHRLGSRLSWELSSTIKSNFVKELKSEARKKEKTINLLRTKVQNNEDTINTLRAEVRNNEDTINTIRTKIRHKENTINTLNAKLSEKEHEILSYALSKSWRITRPLRKLNKIIKRKNSD